MKSFPGVLLTVSAVMLGLAFTCEGRAETVIYSDSFSWVSSSFNLIVSNKPVDHNLPDKAYESWGYGEYGFTSITYAGNPAPGIVSDSNTTMQSLLALPLSDSGTYVKPTRLTVSADLELAGFMGGVGGLSSANPNPAGAGLGFYSSNQGIRSTDYFTGLILDHVGQLTLVQCVPNGTDSLATTSILVAWGGIFNPASFHTLSYTVDTTTGKISNVSLGDSTADYDDVFKDVTLFTDAATTYVGMEVFTDEPAGPAVFDNFLVVSSPIPEPSTLALLACGLVGLLAYAWRKGR